jgi:hypothetical protein
VRDKHKDLPNLTSLAALRCAKVQQEHSQPRTEHERSDSLMSPVLMAMDMIQEHVWLYTPMTRMDTTTQAREGSCYGENLMWMWNARMVDQEEKGRLAVDLSRMLPNRGTIAPPSSTGAPPTRHRLSLPEAGMVDRSGRIEGNQMLSRDPLLGPRHVAAHSLITSDELLLLLSEMVSLSTARIPPGSCHWHCVYYHTPSPTASILSR